MARIVITEFMDAPAVAQLAAKHEVLYDATLVDDAPRLLTEAAKADAIVVRNRTQVRGALLDAAPKLKVVGRLGVGLDNIDLEACARRNIAVLPASGANDLSVAEYVITSAMMLLRGAYLASGSVAAGKWPRNTLIGREMSGKVMGLAGFGSIARLTAKLAAAMGMKVIAFDPLVDDAAFTQAGVQRQTFENLLALADVVSLHVPLNDKTRNMIDGSALSRMRPDAILINAARGGVVDEAAVAAALRAKKLGGAALDVFVEEPLKASDVFADAPNLILTPHIAGVTVESNTRVSWVTVENVKKALSA